ncbi:response regulator [Paucimonas lemoignei]|uniref:response regulator n=1 Tax=Paucimonas lemoignei TaxID=29443 RepID=UPI00104E0B90|nr:response regulator [Paucimonas lemoignei]
MNRSHAPVSTVTAPRCLRIFLVEDSKAVRDLLIQNLTNIPGIELVGYADGENDALEQLSSNHCDVLILDIRLKQGNGVNLLRSLNSLPNININVKVIFTNNASDTYRRACTQYGVAHFFDKSTDFLQLRSLMNKLASSITIS